MQVGRDIDEQQAEKPAATQDIEGMPGAEDERALQSHRYSGFEENGDEDSDEEDIGRAFEMVRIDPLGSRMTVKASHALLLRGLYGLTAL